MDGNPDTATPLAQAVGRGHHDVVGLLISKGAAVPDPESAEGKKMIDAVRGKGDLKMERLLLEVSLGGDDTAEDKTDGH